MKITCGEDCAIAGLEQATVIINRLDEDEKTNRVSERCSPIFLVRVEKGHSVCLSGMPRM